MAFTRNPYQRIVYNLVQHQGNGMWHILVTDEEALLCGKENDPAVSLHERKMIRNLNMADMRIQAAEMQNNDQPVCAQCVAGMYGQSK